MSKEIVLTAMGDNIKAQLAEKPTAWACGKSKYEAIGELVYQHREEFRISIGFNRDDKPTREYLEKQSCNSRK